MIPLGVCAQIEQIVRKFVWCSTSGGQKLALVKWETCCKPILNGGLGMRKLVPQNVAYLIKLAYQLVNRKDSLWVRVV